jgi:F420H(2)-dependent quinone reductase
MLQYQAMEPFETAFFRTLNAFVEPMVRAGVGSPGLWPTGAIVLETTGRKTGRTFNVPVLATLVADLVVVATVRPRSQWMKNLASVPDVRYWMGGRAYEATAFVIGPGAPSLPSGVLSSLGQSLVGALAPFSALWGVSFAILSRAHPGPARSAPDRTADDAEGPSRSATVVRVQDARRA